jgi:hypothetical protein
MKTFHTTNGLIILYYELCYRAVQSLLDEPGFGNSASELRQKCYPSLSPLPEEYSE